MEFFIPGFCILFVTVTLSYFIIPKATPLIASILSVIFLLFGVYEHYLLFASEYRLSTWQEGLKAYAPGVMIFVILIFIIYSIFAFFTNGSVPIPSMPSIPSIPSMPSKNAVTNAIMESANGISNSFSNTKNALMNIKPTNTNKNTNKNTNINKNKNKMSTSFLETI